MSSRGALGGIAGGVVGAMIWAGIAKLFGVEVGWIAWLVGVLVGGGVLLAGQGKPSNEAGWIAAGIALLSITAGKYAAVELVVSGIAWADEFQITEEQAIASIAAGIMMERGAEDNIPGKLHAWQARASAEGQAQAELEPRFPPDIWRAARLRWENLSPEGQRGKMAETEEAFLEAQDAMKAAIRGQGFLGSFSPFDILWALLAIGSAFKVATVQLPGVR